MSGQIFTSSSVTFSTPRQTAYPRIMKLATKLVGIAAVFFCVASCRAQSIEGDWVGGYQLNGEWTSLLAHFKSEQQATKGTFEIESFDESKIKPSVELKDLNLSGSRLRFEMPSGATAFGF